MSRNTEIGWTNHSWPVIRGCSKVSEGCRNCWAIRDAHLHAGNQNPKQQAHFGGLTVIENGRPNWTGEVRLDESIYEWPLHWKKPARIFTASSGDLWHEKLSVGNIADIYAMMAYCQWHTFQVLTKRPENRLHYFTREDCSFETKVQRRFLSLLSEFGPPPHAKPFHWPLPNVWEGVSVEDQTTADDRIPVLLRMPAALRFVSYEPALGPIDFRNYLPGPLNPDRSAITLYPSYLGWGIVGGESGAGARQCDLKWIETAVQQFRGAGVPLFVKQLGSEPITADPDYANDGALIGNLAERDGQPVATWSVKLRDRKGADPREWPARILVQEFPR